MSFVQTRCHLGATAFHPCSFLRAFPYAEHASLALGDYAICSRSLQTLLLCVNLGLAPRSPCHAAELFARMDRSVARACERLWLFDLQPNRSVDRWWFVRPIVSASVRHPLSANAVAPFLRVAPGLRSDFALTEEMKDIAMFGKFVGKQIEARKLLNSPVGQEFFKDPKVEDGKLLFVAPHCFFATTVKFYDNAMAETTQDSSLLLSKSSHCHITSAALARFGNRYHLQVGGATFQDHVDYTPAAWLCEEMRHA